MRASNPTANADLHFKQPFEILDVPKVVPILSDRTFASWPCGLSFLRRPSAFRPSRAWCICSCALPIARQMSMCITRAQQRGGKSRIKPLNLFLIDCNSFSPVHIFGVFEQVFTGFHMFSMIYLSAPRFLVPVCLAPIWYRCHMSVKNISFARALALQSGRRNCSAAPGLGALQIHLPRCHLSWRNVFS